MTLEADYKEICKKIQKLENTTSTSASDFVKMQKKRL